MSSPPPPPPQPRSDSSPNYYYFIITVAVIATMLLISNAIAFACCSPCHFIQSIGRFFFRTRGVVAGSGRFQELIPVCHYRKEQAFDTECSVCLTGFMDGEEVRQLPGCKHSFHAPCIDMWLYSHSSCPLCRACVALPRCPRAAAAAGELESGQHQPTVAEPREMARVVVALM